MNDKQFDQHLKGFLENLEPAYEPATWAQLEQRMNSVFTEETPAPVDAVDKAVYHALERLEAPFQPAHWDLMAQRLQNQALQIRRIRFVKIVEAAILVLFVLNLDFFFGNTATTAPARRNLHPNVPVAEMPGNRRPGPGQGRWFANHPAANPETAAPAWAADALNQTLANTGSPDLLSADYLTAQQVPEILSGLQTLAGQAMNRVYAALTPADLLPTDALSALSRPDRSVLMPAAAIPKYKHFQSTYLAAYGSADHNWGQVKNARYSSNGYGAGMAVGYRPSEWGVETGVAYAHKNQAPANDVVELYSGNVSDGYWGTTMTAVSSDLITVPVKATRQIARMGKARVHVVAGLTANFAAQKTYDYGTVYYPPDFFPPNAQPDPNQQPKLQAKGRGLLEHGGIRNNFYASVDAGIRVEQPIAKGRYTAFLEPVYRQSITGKGVGPKREPTNSVGIQAGIMAYL